MADFNQEIPEWNEKEFLSFVLLYAAHIDMDYSKEEKKMIQELLDKEHYVRVRDKFRELNDAQCLNLIQEFKGIYYPTEARAQSLLSKLDQLFKLDGSTDNLEFVTRSMLHRLL